MLTITVMWNCMGNNGDIFENFGLEEIILGFRNENFNYILNKTVGNKTSYDHVGG